MTLASRERRQRHLLVCEHRAGTVLSRKGLRALLVKESRRALVFDISGKENRVFEAVATCGLRVTPRYMDQFYFCTASEEVQSLRGVIDEVFDSIAETYHNRVDVVRNRENVRNLLNLVCGRIGQPGWVLDFGCGIGLAKPVAEEFGVDLVGYEPNHQMRARAVDAGLRTWGVDGLRSCPRNSLRGAMASYVLHLPGVLADLELVWCNLLGPSGVFVGNFHKAQGRAETTEMLTAWGAKIELVAVPESWRRHGDYVVYRRA